MAQFNCPVCDKGFNQKSRLERHMMTSHPEQAPSVADMERTMQSPSAAKIASLFEGISFPASVDDLKNHLRDKADKTTMQTVERFRHKTYYSMADVTKELETVSYSRAKA